MTNIISASRRTDIPRYFGEWFTHRRKAGTAMFRNAFGGRGEASLRDTDVLGYLFWTKYALPFAGPLASLRDDGIPYVFQYTITGYGQDVEAHIPRRELVIEDFKEISRQLPSPACIQWRYDPIVLSELYDEAYHRTNFAEIARALEGTTRAVNISFVEPYAKTVRRLDDPTVQFRQVNPNRHKQVSRRHPDLLQIGEAVEPLIGHLAEVADKHGMELRACCNPEWGLDRSRCCGLELFAPYGEAVSLKVKALTAGPSREACQCLKTIDIGMDNTCIGGCKYCYVVTSHELAVRNFKQHNPTQSMLR